MLCGAIQSVESGLLMGRSVLRQSRLLFGCDSGTHARLRHCMTQIPTFVF